MPTINTQINAAWTKVAADTDANLLMTWDDPRVLEIATTAADAQPTVLGHRLSRSEAITRGVLGAGFVWARVAGGGAAGVTAVVTK